MIEILKAFYPDFLNQEPLTPDKHCLLIIPGDEELWCRCTCGWTVPQGYPARPDQNINNIFENWYWNHGQEHVNE